MDDKSLVFVFAQHLVEEALAGAALLIKNASLAQAGIDQQAERQREIGFFREVVDVLWMAVFFQDEIVFAEAVDNLSVLVAHRRQYVDHFDLNVQRTGGRLLLAVQLPRRQVHESRRQCQRETRQSLPHSLQI